MKREKIKKALASIGYSDDGIKSIMSCRRRPRLESQYQLKDQFGIPLEAWRDIKSFISNDGTKSKQKREVA